MLEALLSADESWLAATHLKTTQTRKKSPEMIFHIVKEIDFRQQNDGAEYRPPSLASQRFVHCALEESVIPVANDYYGSTTEKLLLLKIDPAKLKSETKYEAAMPEKGVSALHTASAPVFPHVYGAIQNSAVDGIGVLVKENGVYVWPTEFLDMGNYSSVVLGNEDS